MGGQNDPGTIQQEAGFGFEGRFWMESFNVGMTALAGGGQTNASQIDSMYCVFSTVGSANDSAQLPAATANRNGLSIGVVNAGTKPMQVYAQHGTTDTINGIAGSTGVSQMPNSVVYYSTGTTGQWQAQGIGSGYAGAFTTQSFADSLTAQHTAPSQATGTLITTSIARFTTVQSNGDAATLPLASGGMYAAVINAGASIMNVYPASGDAINGLGANNAFAVPSGAIAEFFTTVGGFWHTTISNTAPQQSYKAVSTAPTSNNLALTGANIGGGSIEVTLNLTAVLGAGATLTLPTVAQLVAAMTAAGVNPAPGQTIELVIMNSSSGAFAWTVTTATGWTLIGTMTIAQTTLRKFYITLNTISTATLQSLGQFAIGADI